MVWIEVHDCILVASWCRGSPFSDIEITVVDTGLLLRDDVWGIVAIWRMRLAVSPSGGWHRTTAIANSSSGPRKVATSGSWTNPTV
jgi:hypothetical protein